MQYQCSPLSRATLRGLASEIRKQLGWEKSAWLPVMKLLEGFHEIIGDPEFSFQCDPDETFDNGIHAEFLPDQNMIRIRESVYLGAYENNGRDRMTIVHELAHVILIKVCEVRFARCFDNQPVPTYCDPEWQAKCLAGELMVPYKLMKDKEVSQITLLCGVSADAASYQKRCFK